MKHAVTIINKMNRLILVNVFILSSLVFFNSCKHDNFKEFVGPNICPTPAFVISSPLSASPSSGVNLNTTPVIITAVFNETIPWTLTLIGTTSGATRVYTARSNEVNITWRGEPGTITFFQAEVVTVELKIACKDAITSSFTIGTASNFSTYAGTGRGVLLSDFEVPQNGTVANSWTNPGYNATGWSSYWTLPNQITEYGLGSALTAPQGTKYMIIKGTTGPKSWYTGGGYATMPSLPVSSASANPDSVYLNVLINRGSNTTTLLGLTLQANSTNYTALVPLNWVGWKMVSIKLSDFLSSNGLVMANPQSCTALTFELQPVSAMGQPVEVNVDFVMFTIGEPFLGK